MAIQISAHVKIPLPGDQDSFRGGTVPDGATRDHQSVLQTPRIRLRCKTHVYPVHPSHHDQEMHFFSYPSGQSSPDGVGEMASSTESGCGVGRTNSEPTIGAPVGTAARLTIPPAISETLEKTLSRWAGMGGRCTDRGQRSRTRVSRARGQANRMVDEKHAR